MCNVHIQRTENPRKKHALQLIFSFLIVQMNGILLILEREHTCSRIRILEYIRVRIEKTS